MLRSALGLVSLGLALGVMATACSSAQEGNCPVGTYPDAATGGCIQSGGGQCPQGTVFNGAQCVPSGGGACPAGQQWNGSMCAPAAQCPAGTTLQNGQCVQGGGIPNPFGGSSCTPAQQVDPTFAAAGLNVLALQQAPGAQAVGGAALAGNFQAGQCLEVQVQLDPSKCYTAIGQGAPSELDVQLAAPIPGPLPPFAQDNMQGSTAILGGGGNCFRPIGLFAIPAKLVIKANAGAGPAAVQLYAK